MTFLGTPNTNQYLYWDGSKWIPTNENTLGTASVVTLTSNASNLTLSGGASVRVGSGSPNGAVTGSPGDIYFNTTGATGQTFWTKQSGSSTNTGWIAGVLDTAIVSSNSDVTVVSTTAKQVIGMKALSTNRNVTLPASPSVGQTVKIKDIDGSLASFNIVINGNGNNIDGLSTFTLSFAQGPKSSLEVMYVGADGWIII